MEIIIKESNLNVSHKLEAELPNEISPEQVMLAAYEVLTRNFGQRAVVNVYCRTDPDSMVIRDEDDDFLKNVKLFGYDDLKVD